VIYNAVPLSERETALLRSWERRRLQHIRLQEIAEAVGPNAASDTARALVRKGVLDRIGRGIYAIRPFRAIATPWTRSALVLVAHLLGDDDYYVGGPAALMLNRLTQQAYGSVIDVYTVRYLPPRTLGNARIVFHRTKPDIRRFLTIFGITITTLEQTDVKVSDEQRTLLDALDYPDAYGGLTASVPLVAASISKVDHSLITDYALILSRTSTCQRLGVLLERAGADEEILGRLRNHLKGTKNLPAMIPAFPRIGRVHPVWHIVENDVSLTASIA
jgi:predicted transcriptional regulator of viral defense system